MKSVTRGKRVAAEALGSAMLLTVVMGSSMMAGNLAGGNAAVALPANSLATGCGLMVLILIFSPISGAHFNPLVPLMEAWQGKLVAGDVLHYLAAQLIGAFAGVAVAHLMFGEPLFSAAAHARSGAGQWLGEFIASFGLLATVISCSRHRPAVTPFAVAAYIAAAFWFTSSSSFANPALTLARAASDTSAGIRLSDVAGFVAA